MLNFTLKELIESEIVHDNLLIKKQNDKTEFNVNRIFGRAVTIADLTAVGVPSTWIESEVVELWGTRNNFKMAIVVK